MKRFRIETEPHRCTGCLRCTLACSYRYTRAFNPEASRIVIDVSGEACTIVFDSACACCGLCAESCFYGALRKVPEEKL